MVTHVEPSEIVRNPQPIGSLDKSSRLQRLCCWGLKSADTAIHRSHSDISSSIAANPENIWGYDTVFTSIPWSMRHAQNLSHALAPFLVSWHWLYLNLIWCPCTQNYTTQETQSWQECAVVSGQLDMVATAIKRLSWSHMSCQLQ